MIRIIFLVFCIFGALNAKAQAQLFLEQAKENLDVTAGEHRNGSLLIHNTSADPMTIRVYWEDFEYKAPYDGTKDFLPAGTAPNTASRWVTFSPQSFTLPAYGQQKIDYTVTVPEQIQEGHYGVLFFERSSTAQVSNESVNLVTRIGCLFFIEPKNKSKQAVLQDVKLTSKGVTVSFANQGNVVLLPNTTYFLQGNGLVISRGETRKLYIPPSSSAQLEIPLKKLEAGHYTLVINSDLQEGDVVVKEIGLAVDAAGQITIENTQN
jgi:P pilus assembly chaperone PapD